MDRIPPPSHLDLSGNLSESWRRFSQRMEFYLQAIGKDKAPDATKIAILLSIAGEDALDVYNTFEFAATDQNMAGQVLYASVIVIVELVSTIKDKK